MMEQYSSTSYFYTGFHKVRVGAGGDRSYQWGRTETQTNGTLAFACYCWASIMPRDVYSAFEIRKLESREFGAVLPDYINATSSVVLKALDKKS